MKPDDFSPERAKKLKRWQRNRDHCAGSDAVKGASTKYLPKREEMSLADYEAHRDATNYLPAAARTLQSHVGLVFRKAPYLAAPATLQGLSEVITADAKTLEQLSRWALREYLITNDGGLLIDHPETTGAMSLADAIALDLRPFVARYSAEAIKEVTYGVVRGRKRLIKVRLQDDAETVRELSLVGGVYTVVIHRKSNGQWLPSGETTPMVNGNPFDEIPFFPLGDEDEEGAAFDDLVSKNLEHYLAASKHETAMLWLSRPKPWVAGVDTDVTLDASPGVIWRFTSPETKVGMLQLNSDSLSALVNHLSELKEQMAQLGSRMLASEKAVAEAAETVARRQASENSILAAVARHVSGRITDALKVMALWLALSPAEVSFALSTDFLPAPIDPQLLAQLTALNQAGKLTDRELFDALQKGEIISETTTFEAHQAELDSTVIDKPIGE